MTQTLVVSLPPGVHLSVLVEGYRKLTAAAHLHYIQILQLLHQLGRLAAIAASATQFTVVAVAPGPHLAWRKQRGQT